MKRLIVFLLYSSLIVFLFSCQQSIKKNKEINDDKPYVIMLSLDGFRWNYTEDIPTPNFDKLSKEGSFSVVQSSFPTKTFPNHYTIATGLYPDHHGIVSNSFYDPEKNEVYNISDRSKVQDGYFYNGEPIWNTAEKQGIKTASFFWVGSEANIQGKYPSIWKKYNKSIPWQQRVDSVISWLILPEKDKPHLILWYVSEPDGTGHKYGPESNERKEMIVKLDSLIGYFLAKLDSISIGKNVNIIITSDHGMEEIRSDKFIVLDELIPKSWYEMALGGNPVFNIWAKKEFKDSIFVHLSKVKNIKIYEKENIPQRLNYMSNSRCGDYVIVADSGYSIALNRTTFDSIAGTHGYDNANTNMDVIFWGKGPAFKENYKGKKFQNVDIYNLISKILTISPAPNDGDNDAFQLLKNH